VACLVVCRVDVSCGDDRTVRVWDRAGGREVARTGGAAMILACAVDAAGQQVVVAAEHLVQVFTVVGLDAGDGER